MKQMTLAAVERAMKLQDVMLRAMAKRITWYQAAEIFLRHRGSSWRSESLKELQFVPRVIITDKLKSYSAAKAEVMPSVEHLQQKYQNNQAENSHQPTRLREKLMRRFKSAGHAQHFLSVFGIITSFFRVGRDLYTANGYREVMKTRFAVWQEAIYAQPAA